MKIISADGVQQKAVSKDRTQQKIVSKDGTQIAYDKTGQGSALVLVDGAFCYRTYGITPKLAPLLSRYFTVYSYDRRGRGESTDVQPYSIEREIEDLKAIVEITNEQPFIFGNSSGAALVIHSVWKGLPVRKIALFEPPYVVVDNNDIAPPGDAKTILANFIDKGEKSAAVKYFLTNIMGMPAPFVFLFKLFGRSMWAKNEEVAHTLPYEVALMGNYSVPKEISSTIKVPTMVIGGEKSPDKLRKAAKNAEQSFPNAGISVLKGQGHNISMEVLAPVLVRFFIGPS